MPAMIQKTSSSLSQGKKKNHLPFLLGLINMHNAWHLQDKRGLCTALLLPSFPQLRALPTAKISLPFTSSQGSLSGCHSPSEEFPSWGYPSRCWAGEHWVSALPTITGQPGTPKLQKPPQNPNIRAGQGIWGTRRHLYLMQGRFSAGVV